MAVPASFWTQPLTRPSNLPLLLSNNNLDPEDLCRRLEQVKLDEAQRKALSRKKTRSSPSLQQNRVSALNASFNLGLHFYRTQDAEREHSGGQFQVHGVKDSSATQPQTLPESAVCLEKHELQDTRRKDSRTDASTTATVCSRLDDTHLSRNPPAVEEHRPTALSLSSKPSSVTPASANSSRPYASLAARPSSSPAPGSSSVQAQVLVPSSQRHMASKSPLPPQMSPNRNTADRPPANDLYQQPRASLQATDCQASQNSVRWDPASPPPVHFTKGYAMFPSPPSLSSVKKKPRPASTGFEQLDRPTIVVTADDAPPLPRSNRFSTRGNFDWAQPPEGKRTKPIDNSRFRKGSNGYENRLTVNFSLQRKYSGTNFDVDSQRSSMGGQWPSRIVSGDYTLPGPHSPTPTSPKFPVSVMSNPNAPARSSTIGTLPSNTNRNSVRFSSSSLSHHPRLVKKDSLEQHRWREKAQRERVVGETRARREKEKEGGGIGMGSSPVLPSLSPFPPLSISAAPGQGASPHGQLNIGGVGRRGSAGAVGGRRGSVGNSYIFSQLDRRTSNGTLNGNICSPQLDRRMSNRIVKGLDRRMSNSAINGTAYSTYPPTSSINNAHRLSGIRDTPAALERASTTSLNRRSLTAQTSSSSLPQTSRAEKRTSRIGSQHAILPLLLNSPANPTFPQHSHGRNSTAAGDVAPRLPHTFPQIPAEPIDVSDPQESRMRGRRRSSVKDTDATAARRRSKSATSVHSTKSTKSRTSVHSNKSTHSIRSFFSTSSATSNKLQKRNSTSTIVSREHLAALAALTGPTPPPDDRMTPQSIVFLEVQKRRLEERQRRESVARDREERMERLRRGREIEKVLSGDIIGGALGGYRDGDTSRTTSQTDLKTDQLEMAQNSGVRSSTPTSQYSGRGRAKHRYTIDDQIGELDTSIEGLTPESIRLLREREKLVRWRAEREKQLFEQREREREERVRAANEKEALRMGGLEKGGKKGEKLKRRGCFAWWPFR